MNKPKIYVACAVLPEVRTMLESRCEARFNDAGTKLSPEALGQAAQDCEAVIVTMANRLDAAGMAQQMRAAAAGSPGG